MTRLGPNRLWRTALVAVPVLLAGCVGPTTRLPAPEPAAIDATQAELQRDAVAFHLARSARIHALMWPLLAANATLCAPRTALRTGLFLTDARVLAALTPGLDAGQVARRGLGATTEIGFVMVGSPAAQAGILPGSRLVAINGRTVPVGAGAHRTASLLNGALARRPDLVLELSLPDGTPRSVSLTAVPVCAVSIGVDPGDAINAFASPRRIAVLAGLERSFTDDEVRVVLAHELAHWLLRHPQRAAQASILSGGAVLGAVAGALGTAADAAARWAGQRPPVSYGRLGQALATYPYARDFEREADYVGLYLAARAGVAPNAAESVFRRFALERPANTHVGVSHPISPERLSAVRMTAREIEAKRAQGAALLPEGWPGVAPAPGGAER